jgi:hypothetical protein
MIARGDGRRQISAEDGLTLSALLDRLETNILEYRKSVPNLLCTERAQVDSKTGGVVLGPNLATPGGSGSAEHSSTTEVRQRSEATFRLRRLNEPGELGWFDESRIVESIDGKVPPPEQAAIASPVMLYGVFSNGLNLLSQEGRSCFAFRLHAKTGKQIVVQFADLPGNERASNCGPLEHTTGRILVDPLSMHVVHIEKKVPHHELTPGVFGLWEWSEEYAPVTLLGQVFWMPRLIRSQSQSEDRGSQWTFDATYVDYHLFHAEVRIVP